MGGKESKIKLSTERKRGSTALLCLVKIRRSPTLPQPQLPLTAALFFAENTQIIIHNGQSAQSTAAVRRGPLRGRGERVFTDCFLQSGSLHLLCCRFQSDGTANEWC